MGRPRSRAAAWCQRLAVFSIPYFVIVILGHRTNTVDTISTFWLLGVGVFILLASLAAGALGFYELWTDGKKGGMNATRGVLLSLALMSPFVYFAFKALALPQIYDVATDLEDPPAYDMVLDDRSEEMNPVVDPGDIQKRLQLQAYPRVAARRYRLDLVQVFRQIVGLIGERDWTILTAEPEQGQAPIDLEGSALVSRPAKGERGLPLLIAYPKTRPVPWFEQPASELLDGENLEIQLQPAPESTNGEGIETQPEPASELAVEQDGLESASAQIDPQAPLERYVEAVATSFLFGFESDVVIRLIEEEDGTLVDMRATSRWGAHDLGSNASRVNAFLTDLDAALQGLSR